MQKNTHAYISVRIGGCGWAVAPQVVYMLIASIKINSNTFGSGPVKRSNLKRISIDLKISGK